MVNINFKGNGRIDFDGIRNLLESMEDDCRMCDHARKKREGNIGDILYFKTIEE